MQLSPHFSYAELTVTAHRDIINVPAPDDLKKLTYTAGGAERIRDVLKSVMIVTSGYRCAALNCIIGGAMTELSLTRLIDSTTLEFVRQAAWHRIEVRNIQSRDSQHLDGEALDFISPAAGSPFEICRRLMESDIDFDELIWEGTWVHASFVSYRTPRRAVLTYVPGKPYMTGLVDRRSDLPA